MVFYKTAIHTFNLLTCIQLSVTGTEVNITSTEVSIPCTQVSITCIKSVDDVAVTSNISVRSEHLSDT